MFKRLTTTTLYKVHSTGKVGDWSISLYDNEDGTATIQRKSCKVVGGNPVETITNITKGKNIGRSNETTPLEQARSEMDSKINKQIDKGYVVNKPEDGAKVTNALGFIKPMLAQPIEKVKKWSFPVFAAKKLDGHCLLANNQTLFSRGGKPVMIKHITDSLVDIPTTVTLHGEIYIHGETLQRISSLVKKPKPESSELIYYVYDVHTEGRAFPYATRYELVQRVVEKLDNRAIVALEQITINSQNQLDELHAKYLSDGYEGTMVRHGDKPYEDGKRSQSLMKVKDFKDAEFEIIGYEEGKPYIREDRTYQVPVYICQTADGNTFNCTAPGTMEEKDAAFVNADDAIGKMLTVKYFNMTPDNVPFLPVALHLREDI